MPSPSSENTGNAEIRDIDDDAFLSDNEAEMSENEATTEEDEGIDVEAD